MTIKKTDLTIVLIFALGVLSGCGGSDGGMMTPELGPASASTDYGGVRVTASSPRTTYDRGEPIELTISVENSTSGSVYFDFPSTKRYDFSAASNRGVLWSWSRNRTYSPSITRVFVPPGETWTRDGTWDQTDDSGNPVGSGDYTVEGIIPGQSGTVPANPMSGKMLIQIR